MHARHRPRGRDRADETRPDLIKPGPGILVHRTGDTYEVEADPVVGLFGQITTACPARTGTAPNFTFGKGVALIYSVSVSSSGVATTRSTGRSRAVYNYLNFDIPVRSVPVALEFRAGILCVDGGDCIT